MLSTQQPFEPAAFDPAVLFPLPAMGQIAHAIAKKLRAGSAKGKVTRQRRVLREAHEHYLNEALPST